MCDPGNITGNSNRRSIPRKTVWTSHWGECIICGMHLAAKSLCSHIETQHNTYRSFILNQELTVACEVPPVPISVRYRHAWALQAILQFFQRHPQDLVCCPMEGKPQKGTGCLGEALPPHNQCRAENAPPPPPPVCAAYSTKQPCNQCCCLGVRHRFCHR